MGVATVRVPRERSVTAVQETINVWPATLRARPASIIRAIALRVSQEKGIFKLRPTIRTVSLAAETGLSH